MSSHMTGPPLDAVPAAVSCLSELSQLSHTQDIVPKVKKVSLKKQSPSIRGLTLSFSSQINEGDHKLSHLIKHWLVFKNATLSHNPDINL